MASTDPVALLREMLERYLEQSSLDFEVDPGGDFVVPRGSAATWIRPDEWADGQTTVRIWSVTNVGMRVDGKLTRFLAIENGKFVFGGFSLDESRPAVALSHTLLGDFLSRRELEGVVEAVGSTAALYDGLIEAMFGGRRFVRHDAPVREVGATQLTREQEPVSSLRTKLERYLGELFGDLRPDSEGDYVIGSGSAAIWIRPFELEDGRTAVRVWSVTNVDVRDDDELTRYIATENGRLLFGALQLSEKAPEVSVGYTLLGEFLNRKELETAVAAIGLAADHYDDLIKARFGGRLFGEFE